MEANAKYCDGQITMGCRQAERNVSSVCYIGLHRVICTLSYGHLDLLTAFRGVAYIGGGERGRGGGGGGWYEPVKLVRHGSKKGVTGLK